MSHNEGDQQWFEDAFLFCCAPHGDVLASKEVRELSFPIIHVKFMSSCGGCWQRLHTYEFHRGGDIIDSHPTRV